MFNEYSFVPRSTILNGLGLASHIAIPPLRRVGGTRRRLKRDGEKEVRDRKNERGEEKEDAGTRGREGGEGGWEKVGGIKGEQ